VLFNTAQFVAFFVVVLLVHRAVPSGARNTWLLVCSLAFYTVWIPAYLLLLLLEIGLNFLLLRRMRHSPRPRLYLWLSVVFTLGSLAFFKYAAFLIESVAPMSSALLGVSPRVVDILLPLGISFYSFQMIALQVDVYRGTIEPPRTLARYTLFIAFFPQLIAGPILRGAEFLPQLDRGGVIDRTRTRRGVWLIASGLLKKIVFGDFLLARVSEAVFELPGVAPAPVHLIAIYSFAFQIYFDFSGYTDMARGMGCLLGFDLPLNFREPYLSRNPAEFWRRWHVTLSLWLRDYLYIPLGGNRHGPGRMYAALVVTMLLGGLWHGAAWNFVIWGGMHGLLLVVHRSVVRRPRGEHEPFTLGDIVRVVLFFHATCVLWIFFRAPTFDGAWKFLVQLCTGSYLGEWPLLPTLVVVACVALHVIERLVRTNLPAIRGTLAQRPGGAAIEGLALGAVVALALAASGVASEFIYFQF